MSKTYELEARFSLIDGVSAKLGNLGMAGTALNDKMKGLAVGMQRRLDSLGRVAQNVLSYAIYDGMRMVGSAMRSAAGKYIEFNESLVKSGALFDDLDSKAEDYQDRVAGLGKAAREVAKLTEIHGHRNHGGARCYGSGGPYERCGKIDAAAGGRTGHRGGSRPRGGCGHRIIGDKGLRPR